MYHAELMTCVKKQKAPSDESAYRVSSLHNYLRKLYKFHMTVYPVSQYYRCWKSSRINSWCQYWKMRGVCKNLEASDHIIISMWIHYNSPYLAVSSHSLQYKSEFCHSYSMQYLRHDSCLFHFFLVKKLKSPPYLTFGEIWVQTC